MENLEHMPAWIPVSAVVFMAAMLTLVVPGISGLVKRSSLQLPPELDPEK